MVDDNDDDERVCRGCVGEDFLRGLIDKDGVEAECAFCGAEEEATITLEELADHIEGAFGRHFERTSPDPDMFEEMLIRDREINFEWYRHGEPVLYAITAAVARKNVRVHHRHTLGLRGSLRTYRERGEVT